MKFYSIAIDGPAGSGKSTIAKSVAKGLEFTYIDTGAMYRAITLKALELNIRNLADESLYDFILDTKLEFINELMYMDGRDVSKEIRSEEVVKNVSLVSSLKYVRDVLVEKQREMATKDNIVMEGRDITTEVFPDADVKIYLDATVEERANRRYKQNIEKGIECTLEEIKSAIEERDYDDMHRPVGALTRTDEQVYIDSTNMEIEEVIKKILELVGEK